MSSPLPPAARSVPGEDKLQHVQRLLDVLRTDLDEKNLSSSERAATLEKLKVYGRDPKQCDPIFSKEGIETIGEHGFVDGSDCPAAREALRCLANALLLVPRTRQIFVDLGFPVKAAAKFANASVDDEFLLARLMLLITYGTTVDLESLLSEQKLEQSIDEALARHAKTYSGDEKARSPSAMDEMALSETLKLVFNLSHFVKDREDLFIKSVPHLLAILRGRELPPFPLQPPITFVINALINMDLSASKDDAFPPSDPLCNVRRLVEILDKSIDANLGFPASTSWDENGAPLITLLRRIVQTPEEEVKSYLKKQLLPSEEERNQPLGKGTSLAARLLQQSNSASSPNTRESVSYLLFELSNSNVQEFILNVGYGYASGFLVSHNIPIPTETFQADAAASSASKPINPITGQTLESEQAAADPFEGKTEEEKEREAERLFVLFERLKKTGVVKVKNPVEQAVEEGRFQELDD